jgi:hypothetical protein
MFFPHVRSVLMDLEALERSTELRTSGHGRATSEPPNLTTGELAAFRRCNDENLRIEQERIHPRAVLEAFATSCR